MTPFERLHPALRHHAVNSLGWKELRPFQEAVIDPLLAGKHLLILAPTAGGKTEAAFLPVLSRILSGGWQGLSVLYVCPIKALLNNLDARLERSCTLLGRRSALWHGDIPAGRKKAILRDPPDCLLTTPESLEVMLVSGGIDAKSLFAGLQVVIVDEVHAFAGDDRGWHLLGVLSRIQKLCGREFQRLGLSATVGNPGHLLDWLAGACEGPRQVCHPPEGTAANTAEVKLDYVGSLHNAAAVISRLHRGEKRLVFVDSRSKAEHLGRELRTLEVATYITHSSLSQPFGKSASAADLRLSVGDLVSGTAAGLADAFADADAVEVVEGNLLDLDCDGVVSPANSFGDMGGGIDKAIDDFHQGQAQKAVMAAIAEQILGGLPVGAALVVELPSPRFAFVVATVEGTRGPTGRFANLRQYPTAAFADCKGENTCGDYNRAVVRRKASQAGSFPANSRSIIPYFRSGIAADGGRRMDIAAEFLAAIINAFEANKRLADRAVEQVPDDKLHVALDANTNSIAVIMKHVAGNLTSRWSDFLTTDGEKPWRNRDDEFVDSFGGRAELLQAWERGWACLLTTLKGLTPEALGKTVTIRGEPHSVPLALERSLGHTCYHVGQIVPVARVHAGEAWNTLTIPRGGSEQFRR